MREQLIQYVNLLFAGNPGVEDVKEEILQNTLDRYDDLVAQGKAPEAAYRLAIAGIGDISEILNDRRDYERTLPVHLPDQSRYKNPSADFVRLMRAIAVFLLILCPAPVIVLDQFGFAEFGVCLLLAMVAAGVVILIYFRNPQTDTRQFTQHREPSPNAELNKSIKKLISALGLAAYLILSFATGAWAITWLVFPITAALNGLVQACLELWEVNRHEN